MVGRTEAARMKRQQLDPSEVLEGPAVAFFYVGGNEFSGDPESMVLRPGEKPLEVVAQYLRRRLGAGALVTAEPKRSGLLCTATGHDGKPYTYFTQVKCEARKSEGRKRPQGA
jgi:hypothetical protein